MSERCVQCGWTVSERNIEAVTDQAGNVRYLHKGGCPRVIDTAIRKSLC